MPFVWQLPTGTTPPTSPPDNPISAAKVALGRQLFYDKRMSINETTSCASCHQQAKAFTDGQATSPGATGQRTPRSSMSLANVGYRKRLTWANPLLAKIEHQLPVPLFGEDPIELGWSGRDRELLARLRSVPGYRTLFAKAFPSQPDIQLLSVIQAIAAFCRTMVSRNAPYDQYRRGTQNALSSRQKTGMTLFFSQRLSCFRCHGGIDFNATRDEDNNPVDAPLFHNTGLYHLPPKDGLTGRYPKGGEGLYASTLRSEDMGKFRAPTLRNITQTAPYMHDGSIADLPTVLRHYAKGGRSLTTGPHKGEGRTNPHKSPIIKGFLLTPAEQQALLAFLAALTDREFLQNPALSAPDKLENREN